MQNKNQLCTDVCDHESFLQCLITPSERLLILVKS